MKKSTLSLFLGATLVITTLSGCDSTKSDLSNYSKTAVPVYNSYSNKFGSEMEAASKFTTEAEYAAQTKEVVALLDEFRTKMGEFKPETKEVQDLNQNEVTNLTNLEDGYKQLGEAFEKDDKAIGQSAKAKIEDAIKADEKFRSDLKALEEKHHVQVQ